MSIKFIVYGKESCGYCVRALNLLVELNLDHEYIDVMEGSNKVDLLLLCEKHGVVPRTVPQIFIATGEEYEYVGGFDQLHKKLK